MQKRTVTAFLLASCHAMAPLAHAADGPPQTAATVTPPASFLHAEYADLAQPAGPWWQSIGDPQLSALIERGLTHSPSIAASAARIRQARAHLAEAHAAQLPSVAGAASYVHADLPAGGLGGNGGATDLFSLGFDARWELDLWGGKRAATRKSAAQAGAVAAQGDAVRASLAAEIGRVYVTLCARRTTLDLLRTRQELERRLVAHAEQRFAAGAAPRQPLELARSDLARTRAELAMATAESQSLQDMLAMLVGETPQGLAPMATASVPLPPAKVQIGDPAAMLQRRPDIRAAERQLAAAQAQVGVERARRFPSISFLGLLGFGGSGAGDVVDTSSLGAVAVPTLRWSFLDFGRAAAATRAARAGADAAVADYQQAVLAALQDAEAALSRYGGARTGYVEADAAAGNVATRATLDDQRAAAGALAQDQAIGTQRQALDAAITSVNARAEMTIAYIALSKSLGLGWGD